MFFSISFNLTFYQSVSQSGSHLSAELKQLTNENAEISHFNLIKAI